jgi:hypothetical protein
MLGKRISGTLATFALPHFSGRNTATTPEILGRTLIITQAQLEGIRPPIRSEISQRLAGIISHEAYFSGILH